MHSRRLLSLLVPLALAVTAMPAEARQQAMTGSWVLDATRSDDVMKKLEEAMSASSGSLNTATTRGVAAGRAGTRGGAGAQSGGGGGGGGGGNAAAIRPGGRGPAAALLNGETLTIEVTDVAVIYSVGSQNPIMLQPGQPVTMNRWGMDGVEVRTELRNDRLTIDSRGPGNMRVNERYELKRNGEVEANISLNMPGVAQQVRIKRIYVAPPAG